MAELPDEIWSYILEVGIRSSSLTYKDLCCVSISCRRLRRLSNDDVLWSLLFSSYFPDGQPSVSSGGASGSTSFPELVHKIRFERKRARILAAHLRRVRVKNRTRRHSRKAREIQQKYEEAMAKLNAADAELTKLSHFRQEAIALIVWKPELILGCPKQAGLCFVHIDARIYALKMELKLCSKQITEFDNDYRDEHQRLFASRVSLRNCPFPEYPLRDLGLNECGRKRKELKRCIDSTDPDEKKRKLEDA